MNHKSYYEKWCSGAVGDQCGHDGDRWCSGAVGDQSGTVEWQGSRSSRLQRRRTRRVAQAGGKTQLNGKGAGAVVSHGAAPAHIAKAGGKTKLKISKNSKISKMSKNLKMVQKCQKRGIASCMRPLCRLYGGEKKREKKINLFYYKNIGNHNRTNITCFEKTTFMAKTDQTNMFSKDKFFDQNGPKKQVFWPKRSFKSCFFSAPVSL